jgi:hypothetical protein
MLFQRRKWGRIAENADAPRESSYEPEKPPPKWTPPGWLEWLDFVVPESFLAILVAAGAIAIVFAIWYCISLMVLAPEFLSELFPDGVFSAALYRRLNRIEQQQWLRTVFVKTRAPFLWTLLFFVFLGVISQILAPEAISIGGVIRHLTRR